MTCEELLAALDRQSSRDPAPGLSANLLNHMAGCADCRAAYDIHIQLVTQRAEVELPLPPSGMEAAISNRIDALVSARSSSVQAVTPAPGRWPWVSAAIGLGVFVLGNLNSAEVGKGQPVALAEHLLPGLLSDRLSQMLTGATFVPESGAMVLGVMLVLAGFFSLAGRPG